jgi:hypothetical protein
VLIDARLACRHAEWQAALVWLIHRTARPSRVLSLLGDPLKANETTIRNLL